MIKIKNKIWLTLFTLGAILWSCNSLIYDDLSDCPQGVYVSFYNLTPCDTDTSYVGNVPALSVFAFDSDGKLAAISTRQNVNLTRDYKELLPLSNGDFTFYAWAGYNENFNVSTFTEGVTTKEDVMLALRTAEGVAPNLGETTLWQGEGPAVFLPDPADYASVFKASAINLKEVTNRLKLIFEFDPNDILLEMDEFSVAVSSENGEQNIDGSVKAGTPAVSYPALSQTEKPGSFTWDFALMGLSKGMNNNLLVTYDKTGESVFNGDILRDLLLNTVAGNINPECITDYEIKIKITEYCETCESHLSVVITVNDWVVHEYEVDLGN